MATKRLTLKVHWYIDRLNGEDCIVMGIGSRTRILPLAKTWRRLFAKRYIREHLQASKN